jgi:hypothetical protein
MPDSDTVERVTPVLDFPSPDGHAVRVGYGWCWFSRVHRHPVGACAYVIGHPQQAVVAPSRRRPSARTT